MYAWAIHRGRLLWRSICPSSSPATSAFDGGGCSCALPARFRDAPRTNVAHCGARRNIREPGGRGVIGRWHLVVDTKKDEFAVREGAAPKRPTLLLTTSVRTLVGIGRGQVNPVTAMLRGRLRLKGNLLTGSRLEAAFRAAGGYTFAREFVDVSRPARAWGCRLAHACVRVCLCACRARARRSTASCSGT